MGSPYRDAEPNLAEPDPFPSWAKMIPTSRVVSVYKVHVDRIPLSEKVVIGIVLIGEREPDGEHTYLSIDLPFSEALLSELSRAIGQKVRIDLQPL